MDACRILVADDHELFRAGLKSLIDQKSGLKIVGQAKDGEEVLAKLKSIKCDLLILDLAMPKIDGMQALKEISEKYPKVKVLVLTMQKDQEHFKHAMGLGASGYLLKDDAYEQLLVAIDCIMKNKQFVSPSITALLTDIYLRSSEEAERSSLDILTKRELQILKMIGAGMSNKNIATQLSLSVRTVEAHRAHLTHKLGLKNTAGLVKFAISKGLI